MKPVLYRGIKFWSAVTLCLMLALLSSTSLNAELVGVYDTESRSILAGAIYQEQSLRSDPDEGLKTNYWNSGIGSVGMLRVAAVLAGYVAGGAQISVDVAPNALHDFSKFDAIN